VGLTGWLKACGQAARHNYFAFNRFASTLCAQDAGHGPKAKGIFTTSDTTSRLSHSMHGKWQHLAFTFNLLASLLTSISKPKPHERLVSFCFPGGLPDAPNFSSRGNTRKATLLAQNTDQNMQMVFFFVSLVVVPLLRIRGHPSYTLLFQLFSFPLVCHIRLHILFCFSRWSARKGNHK